MIEVSNLNKIYGKHAAIRDVNFTVSKGSICGLLGPNGAGKTTVLSIVCGCLAATSGSVSIDRYDILTQPVEAKKRIGYLPEIPPVYPEMTPLEYLSFVAQAKGFRGEAARAHVQRAMEATRIVSMQQRIIKNLSKGYRQRVGIAQALLGEPKILILDEPFVGLDPKQIVEVRELIDKLRADHTIIFSSHILGEVSSICNHIVIISNGQIVANDTTQNIKVGFAGSSSICMTVRGRKPQVISMLGGIGEIKEFELYETAEDLVDISIKSAAGNELCEKLFFACCRNELPILAMLHKQSSLESVFLELTKNTLVM